MVARPASGCVARRGARQFGCGGVGPPRRDVAEAPVCVCFGPWTIIPNQVRTQHDRPDEDLHGPYSPTPSRHGSESPGDLSPGDQRDGPADGRRGEDAGASDRRGRQRRPRPDGPRQPPAGGQHRPRLCRQGPGTAGPDRGGEPRPAPRRGGVRPRRSGRGSAPMRATGSSSRSSGRW